MRDHNTNYSKGSTEPARMMTPFLASNVFGSIRSNSTTTFCPSLNWHGHSLAACSTVWTLRGHNSKAVHRAYAKRALMKIPSLEDYERQAAVEIA